VLRHIQNYGYFLYSSIYLTNFDGNVINLVMKEFGIHSYEIFPYLNGHVECYNLVNTLKDPLS
jgi:hypothetical protein